MKNSINVQKNEITFLKNKIRKIDEKMSNLQMEKVIFCERLKLLNGPIIIFLLLLFFLIKNN